VITYKSRAEERSAKVMKEAIWTLKSEQCKKRLNSSKNLR